MYPHLSRLVPAIEVNSQGDKSYCLCHLSSEALRLTYTYPERGWKLVQVVEGS